ncbi:MAG: hydantoinase/oxoprolinase family protein [Candidatus Nitrospinota bacterium M3_3B_026]
MRVLGLDVGGAHVKYALYVMGAERLPERGTLPFEIFREQEILSALLKKTREETRPDAVALTMTGELSDVFRTRREGARWIVRTGREAMRPLPLKVVDVDGALVDPSRAMREWAAVASANWAAVARWVSRHVRDCLVVDIGSTTVDILPVKNGEPAARGRTDLERLMTGELLYTGYLRTNAAFVLPEVMVRGRRTRTCPEHFAIMGDIHLYLGDMGPKDYTTSTPDGRAKSKRAAGERIARLVLSEAAELGGDEIRKIAAQASQAQARRITDAVMKVLISQRLRDAPVILTGPGGRIYRDALRASISVKTLERVGRTPAGRIDPAACAAALWEQL